MNSYQMYKTETAKIDEWLLKTIKRDANKKKPGRKPKVPTQLTTVQAYLDVAESLATARSKLPRDLVPVIENVIRLRKRANTFFETNDADSEANRGHRYFIGVLERMLELLRPDGPQSKVGRDKNAESNISNMFGNLTVDEPTESQISSHTEPKRDSRRDSIKIDNVAKAFANSEITFAIQSLFEDTQEIRKHIRKAWESYKAGKVSAMTAAVTTDIACIIIKDMLKYFSESSPIGDMTYEDMEKHMEPPARDAKNRTQVNEFRVKMCTNAAAILREVLRRPVVDRQIMIRPRPRVATDHPDYETVRDANILSEFLHLLPTMMCACDTDDKKSGNERWGPVLDELSLNNQDFVRMMFRENISQIPPIPLEIIVCFQIYLDIHHTLGEHISAPLQEFQATGVRARTTVYQFFVYADDHPDEDLLTAQLYRSLERIERFTKQWVLSDRAGECARQEKLPIQNPKNEDFQFLRINPVLTGLMTLRLNLMLHDCGVSLCHGELSVDWTAHLYNAARKNCHLNPWGVMDFLIRTQNPANKFFVGMAPSTARDCWRQSSLAMGSSAINSASHRRFPDEFISTNRKLGLHKKSPILQLLFPHYAWDERLELPTVKLEALLETIDHTLGDKSALPANLFEPATKTKPRRQMSPVETLIAIQECTEGEMQHLAFDYLSFHQRVINLYRAVHERIKHLSPGFWEQLKMPNKKTHLSATTWFILKLFAEDDGSGRILLLETAEAIKELIASGEGE